MAALAEAFEDVCAGTPGIMLLAAKAGGGKKRLAAESGARVVGRALGVSAGCVESSAGTLPYAPYSAAVRQAQTSLYRLAVYRRPI